MLDGEESIVLAAVQGSAEAFGILYDHYQPSIYRFVVVKIGRREDAEDLTHQVFLSAWQNIGNYEPRGFPFSSWLYRIARNQIIDHYRSGRPDLPYEELDPDSLSEVAEAENLAELSLSREIVLKAMAKLRPIYQDVILMRFVDDLSVKETAAALKKSEGAVKVLQHRAIRQLREILPLEDLPHLD